MLNQHKGSSYGEIQNHLCQLERDGLKDLVFSWSPAKNINIPLKRKKYYRMKKYTVNIATLFGIILLYSCNDSFKNSPENNKYRDGVNKLEYNNPGLMVDLDVGFKSVPMPMDFDVDEDYGLITSQSCSYVESGMFCFENISGNVDMPVFRYNGRVSSDRFRLGSDGKFFEVSEVGGHTHVLTPDRIEDKLLMYTDVPENVFWRKITLPLSAKGYIENTRANTWKMIDFNGDSKINLMCGLSSSQGDFLLFFKNSGTNKSLVYEAPQKILSKSGKLIGNNSYLETALTDYDNDGDLDYMGVAYYGYVVYFKNSGTPQKYCYEEGDTLKYKSENIRLTSYHATATKLRAMDFNKDVHIDLIIGDEDGKVSFMNNTGRIIDGVPRFLPPRFFQQKAKFVDLGALVASRVFDGDGDGLDDIMSEKGVGNICFVKNLGGYLPKWDAPELLEVDGVPIRLIPTEALPNTEDPYWGYSTM